MFEVNFLNKPGFQVNDGSLDEEQSILKVNKNNSSNNILFLKVSAKMDCTFEFSTFFT